MTAQCIIQELHLLKNPEKAKHLSRFFKTGIGQYGEGDLFLGIPVPQQRCIAKKHQTATQATLKTLLQNPYHEVRLTALLILVEQFTQSKEPHIQKEYIEFYLSQTPFINNWDLVDLTSYKLLGRWLNDKNRSILYKLAHSENIWEQRISIVSCMYFVRQGDFKDCLNIADILLQHPHDLIQKAVGWLLREVGKKNKETLILFLASRHQKMPRTMLRYSIEHFSAEERKQYLLRP